MKLVKALIALSFIITVISLSSCSDSISDHRYNTDKQRWFDRNVVKTTTSTQLDTVNIEVTRMETREFLVYLDSTVYSKGGIILHRHRVDNREGAYAKSQAIRNSKRKENASI
jgi:hypothetical protein